MTYVAEVQTSHSGNSYYDIKIKTAIDNSSVIRVILKQNPTVKRYIFTDKKNSGQPVTVKRVYQTAKGVAFYNSFRGSSVDNVESIDVKVDETKCVSLGDLTSKSSGSFSVEGMIRWRAPEV